ncbi:MAG: DegT/DnrJ/EryC1/StrS family aminotransferase [Candidatus Paceibacterota bacterium]|jgi:dTDP-4-amino-4,6-dideoxygalactose transaminase
MKEPRSSAQAESARKPIPVTRPTLEDFAAYEPLFRESIKSGMLTTNKHVQLFEKKTARYLGVKHCVAVSSCTSGLMLVLKGLGLTGEVIVPSFTFSATGHVLLWNNLKPVFADIDPQTYTIDPKSVEKLITPRTSAILAVHVFGVMSDVKKLEALAKKYKLKLVFDAAHAFGSDTGGVRAGNFGNAEVFSCSPIKVLTAGEGGIVATNDDELAAFCRLGRNYGDDGTNNTLFAGLSARMSEFHAAIGLRSLAKLPINLKNRRLKALQLISRLKKIEPRLRFQLIPRNTRTTYYVLSVFIDPEMLGYTRDELFDFFAAQGIATRKYFYPPLHKQTTYQHFVSKRKPLPVTDNVAERVISLPLYAHLSAEEVDRIIGTFQEFTSAIIK